jgi:PIN domain nuclease of toxin-antitoxin system
VKVLIDTHIWIWWLTGQNELSPKNRKYLDSLAAGGTPPCLSAISLWESQMLFRKSRLILTMDFAHWLPQASDPDVIRLLPLDARVVLALDALPKNFHGDPADRIIVATARAHNLALMTEDRKIRQSKLTKSA